MNLDRLKQRVNSLNKFVKYLLVLCIFLVAIGLGGLLIVYLTQDYFWCNDLSPVSRHVPVPKSGPVARISVQTGSNEDSDLGRQPMPKTRAKRKGLPVIDSDVEHHIRKTKKNGSVSNRLQKRAYRNVEHVPYVERLWIRNGVVITRSKEAEAMASIERHKKAQRKKAARANKKKPDIYVSESSLSTLHTNSLSSDDGFGAENLTMEYEREKSRIKASKKKAAEMQKTGLENDMQKSPDNLPSPDQLPPDIAHLPPPDFPPYPQDYKSQSSFPKFRKYQDLLNYYEQEFGLRFGNNYPPEWHKIHGRHWDDDDDDTKEKADCPSPNANRHSSNSHPVSPAKPKSLPSPPEAKPANWPLSLPFPSPQLYWPPSIPHPFYPPPPTCYYPAPPNPCGQTTLVASNNGNPSSPSNPFPPPSATKAEQMPTGQPGSPNLAKLECAGKKSPAEGAMINETQIDLGPQQACNTGLGQQPAQQNDVHDAQCVPVNRETRPLSPRRGRRQRSLSDRERGKKKPSSHKRSRHGRPNRRSSSYDGSISSSFDSNSYTGQSGSNGGSKSESNAGPTEKTGKKNRSRSESYSASDYSSDSY